MFVLVAQRSFGNRNCIIDNLILSGAQVGSKILRLTPTFNAVGVGISFPPTRSTLSRASAGKERPGTVSNELGLGAQIPGAFLANVEAEVIVVFDGEPLGDPVVTWTQRGSKSVAALSDSQLIEYYNGRAELAERAPDAMYRVLFAFDRMTNPSLLKLGQSDLSEHVRKLYRTEVQTLQRFLLARMKARFEGRPLSPLSAQQEQALHRSMVLVTLIFRRSVRYAGPVVDGTFTGWVTVGEKFCEFAAGAFRDKVTITGDSTQKVKYFWWPVNEPDSAFVFLFGEWALEGAIRGPCKQMWTILLPFFVRMQDFYLARFDPAGNGNGGIRDSLDEFKTPNRRLSYSEWAKLVPNLPFASSVSYAAERTTVNLRRAARTFGDWADGRDGL